MKMNGPFLLALSCWIVLCYKYVNDTIDVISRENHVTF